MFNKKASEAKKLYKQFVLDAIGKEKAIIEKNMITNFVLGNTDFLKGIEKHLNREEDYEIPEISRLKRRSEPTLEHIKQTTN